MTRIKRLARWADGYTRWAFNTQSPLGYRRR